MSSRDANLEKDRWLVRSAAVVVGGGDAPRSELLTARARVYCRASTADVLGICRLPASVLVDVPPAVEPALRLFLPRLAGGDALSRGERYYDVRSALLAWPELVAAARHLAGAGPDAADELVALAVHENLFNVVAAMTFAFWESCCDEPEDVEERSPTLSFLLQVLPALARLHLARALGPDVAGSPPVVDWDCLHAVGRDFPRAWPLRPLREFDNKPRVLNEVFYLHDQVRAHWPFDAVVFPLYGALTLAAYFSALEALRWGDPNSRRVPAVLVRLGLYERGPASFRTPAGDLDVDHLLPRPWHERTREALSGRRVLVVDDNSATGRTLRACREFVVQCGGQPLTRSAETSWELIGRRSSPGPCFEGVDLPGLRTNMSHDLHRSLVALLLRQRWDEYAARAQRLGARSFSAALSENYAAARGETALRPTQRQSVELEFAHARRNWREPGYPPAPSSCGLPWEGFPDGVRRWALGKPAHEAGCAGAPAVAGAESFVLAAGSVTRIRVVATGPGRLRAQLAGWSTAVDLAAGPNQIDLDVEAPATAGGHHLVLEISAPAARRRYPVHVVATRPVPGTFRVMGDAATAAAVRLVGAGVNDHVGPLVIGEDAFIPVFAKQLGATLRAGATALVLAQGPEAAALFPLPAHLEPVPDHHVRFTTKHPALASLPRHRRLSFEDAAMRPRAMFSRLGEGPWAGEVALGMLAADGCGRGTLIGAQPVGPGRLIVCQLPLVGPALAGHPAALGLLADLLRWAGGAARLLRREDVVLPDGRSMSYYARPEGDG
jgi:hypothetical protein